MSPMSPASENTFDENGRFLVEENYWEIPPIYGFYQVLFAVLSPFSAPYPETLKWSTCFKTTSINTPSQCYQFFDAEASLAPTPVIW